ncbi:variable membrane protein precursor [Reticulomyxa filosa]|uniref:Variable membrane protein n=1 Tax=Reticulomyxa filosa TaxID=46433 RepID=X6MQF4_RETFI|nr:variable membrane protein precursor [Reticulomyxa filosa]|eukprot:ETO16238.1 variable membrane protein precursor [Reticulomyxa filosa]
MNEITRHPKQWSVVDVCKFLGDSNESGGVGLPNDVVNIFKDEFITGEALLQLSQEDLRSMGVKMGPTKLILSHIKQAVEKFEAKQKQQQIETQKEIQEIETVNPTDIPNVHENAKESTEVSPSTVPSAESNTVTQVQIKIEENVETNSRNDENTSTTLEQPSSENAQIQSALPDLNIATVANKDVNEASTESKEKQEEQNVVSTDDNKANEAIASVEHTNNSNTLELENTSALPREELESLKSKLFDDRVPNEETSEPTTNAVNKDAFQFIEAVEEQKKKQQTLEVTGLELDNNTFVFFSIAILMCVCVCVYAQMKW